MDDYRSAPRPILPPDHRASNHRQPAAQRVRRQPLTSTPDWCLRTEIGIGLTGAGLLFMLLGMMMFFDKGLLAMGNVRSWP